MKGLIKECADMSYVVSLTKEDDDGAFMIQREENQLVQFEEMCEGKKR